MKPATPKITSKAAPLLIALALLLCLTACDNQSLAQAETFVQDMEQTLSENSTPDFRTPENPQAGGRDNDTVRIASFNLEVFGVTKASRPDTLKAMADIIGRFDVVALQEIRDKSGTAIEALEQTIDQTHPLGHDYDYIIGPRLGRTRSKEQYAFFYDTDRISPVGEHYTYDDGWDIFHREPHIARFKVHDAEENNAEEEPAEGFDFVLINIHVDPDEAQTEIPFLERVMKQTHTRFEKENETDFILTGDMNADCSYYDETQTNALKTHYTWLIADSADTTVSDTDCAYDRIIITDSLEDRFIRQGIIKKLYGRPLTDTISDHYAVWAEFSTGP